MLTNYKLGVLFLILISSLHAEDVVVVDPTGVTTVNGSDPSTPPSANQVLIGGGQIRLGQQGQASPDQAVRGDDPRLVNAISTIQMGVAGGVATLGPDGKVTQSQLHASIGGSGADGTAGDATIPTAPGFYEYENLSWTTPRTLPWFTVIRVRGDASITGALTVSLAPRTGAYVTTGLIQDDPKVLWPFDSVIHRGRRGNQGATNAGAGGGGSMGNGGTGLSGYVGGAGLKRNASNRLWFELVQRPLIGGEGGGHTTSYFGAQGGGALVLIVQGNLTLGANVRADGGHGANSYAGGGGGGTVVVVCAGTINYQNNPVIGAKGGNGMVPNGEDGGNGGSGYVGLIAPIHLGTAVMDVAAPVNGSGAPSEAGLSEQITLSAAILNSLFLGR